MKRQNQEEDLSLPVCQVLLDLNLLAPKAWLPASIARSWQARCCRVLQDADKECSMFQLTCSLSFTRNSKRVQCVFCTLFLAWTIASTKRELTDNINYVLITDKISLRLPLVLISLVRGIVKYCQLKAPTWTGHFKKSVRTAANV